MYTLGRRCHHRTLYCIWYANRSYIMHIGPLFCVLGYDIAFAGSGYITSPDTKRGSYILYIGPAGVVYYIYILCIYIYIIYNYIYIYYNCIHN